VWEDEHLGQTGMGAEHCETLLLYHYILSATKSLTRILIELIEKSEIDHPNTISISFDGTEVYQYHSDEARTYWWGTDSTQTS
jgi:hypothetical protein